MKLTVKCFATLMPLTPPGGSLEFHGTDVCDLLRQLSIPESEARIIFVNGIGVEKDVLLHDGDRVGIFRSDDPRNGPAVGHPPEPAVRGLRPDGV